MYYSFIIKKDSCILVGYKLGICWIQFCVSNDTHIKRVLTTNISNNIWQNSNLNICHYVQGNKSDTAHTRIR